MPNPVSWAHAPLEAATNKPAVNTVWMRMATRIPAHRPLYIPPMTEVARAHHHVAQNRKRCCRTWYWPAHPMDLSALENRLVKNHARLLPFARQHNLTAWRLYDLDMPEYRYTVDAYADHVVVTALSGRDLDAQQQQAIGVLATRILGFPAQHVHHKVRQKHIWGQQQYEKQDQTGERIMVEEQGLRFWVNLTDYLDVGLFLDHRKTRQMVRQESQGKNVLNLFCYTGAFTVYAAAGGAVGTTSVDLSNTYLQWTRDNLVLNNLDGPQHVTLREDVNAWLVAPGGPRFDIIVLDPPSHSVSKRMEGSLDIQRDHATLVRAAIQKLTPGGVLYFSTNFRGFVPDATVLGPPQGRELTPASLPQDIRQKDIHRCWRVVAPS